jgi:ATP-dependent RNA helicase DeaD
VGAAPRRANRSADAETFRRDAPAAPRGGESPVRRREAPGWDVPTEGRARRDAPGWDSKESAGPRTQRPAGLPGRGVWFRMNVGRNDQADPRWLIPLICRRGGVEKNDLGAIRVHDDETRFEVAGNVASRFAQAVKRPDEKDPWVRFQVLAKG